MCKRRLGSARDILVTRRPIHNSRAMRALALTVATHHSNRAGPGFATEPDFPRVQAVDGGEEVLLQRLDVHARAGGLSKQIARRIIPRAGNRF
ncbi:hypothetical protein [Ralstonia solanacearum]|uniref:Uncharacterized protein n=1 Tax=Ralstonia solanacearum (strain Po82) TaxID=1031711 RepID=F6G864_RALS8|nr:hypothetical protein [Ralstonia solanacearum]AEG70815.1 hypothetical protein RSPO_m00174 [Ralstonia solanacearum Po82]AMP72304.1 hypothetical protein UW163_23115 [Ralstonia solanacearum]EUJ13191.1 hypothetical protein RSP673_16990 [Ralstonia solanacearum P673]MBB6589507.1 hypothetical protein [Ralstonia solanacearum]MCG3574801.1 hypothetical protein [Ralstonia solanacearum]